jgi:eight-cysteine-cluster-containing protein
MRSSLLLALLTAAVATACPGPQTAPPPPGPAPHNPAPEGDPAGPPGEPGAERAPAVSPDHPDHDRVEGVSFPNDCSGDQDCHVGGCSAEVCSAEEGVNSTCIGKDWPSAGASCGCVSGQCLWYTAAGETPAPPDDPATGGPDEPAGTVGTGGKCGPDAPCAEGLTCVEYYGIAGAAGPKFASCERRCGKGEPPCPANTTCVTIADGPGQVCRSGH